MEQGERRGLQYASMRPEARIGSSSRDGSARDYLRHSSASMDEAEMITEIEEAQERALSMNDYRWRGKSGMSADVPNSDNEEEAAAEEFSEQDEDDDEEEEEGKEEYSEQSVGLSHLARRVAQVSAMLEDASKRGSWSPDPGSREHTVLCTREEMRDAMRREREREALAVRAGVHLIALSAKMEAAQLAQRALAAELQVAQRFLRGSADAEVRKYTEPGSGRDEGARSQGEPRAVTEAGSGAWWLSPSATSSAVVRPGGLLAARLAPSSKSWGVSEHI